MNYKIKKAKLNGRAITVDMDEIVPVEDSTITNEVTKKCAHLAHEDLLNAFNNLIPHLVSMCDFRGSELVTEDSLQDPQSIIDKFKEFKLGDYTITGVSEGGSDENSGVTIIASRKFPSGKVLNIVTPFTQYFTEDYKFGDILSSDVERCIYEVEQYLFNGKYAEKQLEIDFGGMDEMDVTAEFNADKLTENINKKISKKQKQLAEEAA